jgi:hypothetical protein
MPEPRRRIVHHFMDSCGETPLNGSTQPANLRHSRYTISRPYLSVNGEPQEYDDWPSFAHVIVNNLVCGGLLVSDRHVLTAAASTGKFRAAVLGEQERHPHDQWQVERSVRSIDRRGRWSPDSFRTASPNRPAPAPSGRRPWSGREAC